MENITNAAELKLVIQTKKSELELNGTLLKEEFLTAYESLKPANLIRNTLDDLFSSSFKSDNLSGSISGLISGYLSKKIAVGKFGNIFRKILGSMLQFWVTGFVTQHAEDLKTYGHIIIDLIFRRKATETKKE